MALFRTLPGGRPQIVKDEAFCELLNNEMPNNGKSYSELFEEFDSAIREQDSSITTGALSNSHGDWYEWLLAVNAWNVFVEAENANLGVLLPNVSSLDVSELYQNDLCGLIDDLRTKVAESAGVEFISSNPDFVMIDRELVTRQLSRTTRITEINIDTIRFLQSLYQNFVGHCGFEDILGYVSVKTSLRPDRRLQISHECSLMKALYVHLQTRKWIINPPGLKYYAIATSVGPSDRSALKTVATHSITTVHSIPQAAVDEVYEVNSSQRALDVFSEILL